MSDDKPAAEADVTKDWQATQGQESAARRLRIFAAVAWIVAIGGEIDSLVALDGERIVATTAGIRDPLSWSRHVCELRLLVLPEARGIGLGRALLDRCVARAVEGGATKLVARMTSDQAGAITLFEESGFRAEALLAVHVQDDAGTPYDLAILALDPAREAAKQAAFG